jgi:hypothetical protein
LAFLFVLGEILPSLYSLVPVVSLGDDIYHPYTAYRPVGISSAHYDCKPSEFWFGPILRSTN